MRKQTLFFSLLLGSLLFVSCDPDESESGGSSSSNKIGNIDITNAQALAVVPASSLNSNNSVAAGFALGNEEKVFVKIQADGTTVKVPVETVDGKPVSVVPSKIIHVNDKYLMMELNEWYLIRKSDGAAFDLSVTQPSFSDAAKIYTDEAGNIYYISRGSVVKKVDISNPAAPTAQNWTPDIYSVSKFVVDSKGNTFFSGNDINAFKVAANGNIQRSLESFSLIYRGLDGKIYSFQDSAYGNIKGDFYTYTKKVLSQQPDEAGRLTLTELEDSGEIKVDYNDFGVGHLLYFKDRIISFRSLGGVVELYKEGNSKTGLHTIAALSDKRSKGSEGADGDYSLNSVQMGQNSYYVLTENSGVYRVDESYTATQIFGSNDYDVYKMAVSTDSQGNDTVIFNAFQYQGSKKVTGKVKIAANGTKGEVKLIEELGGVELTLLQRVN